MATSELIINIKSNIPEKPDFEFTSDLYYIPNDKATNYNKYPYFTNLVSFPKTLYDKSPAQLKYIFFNKNAFDSFIKGTEAITEAQKRNNTNNNMKVFIELLMPTYFPIENNYHISFNENIANSMASFQKTKKWESYFIGPTPKFSFIKTGKNVYTFVEVTWVNDLINNKTYRRLFKEIYDFEMWRSTQIKNALSKNKQILESLEEQYEKFFAGFRVNREKIMIIIKKSRFTRGIKLDKITPYLNNLTDPSPNTNYKSILKQFFNLRKLEMDAQKLNNDPYYLPQDLVELPEFKTILNNSLTYYYNTELIKYLNNLALYNDLLKKKKEDLVNRWETYVYNKIKEIREIPRILNIIKKYRKPITTEDKENVQSYQIVSNDRLQEVINNFGLDEQFNNTLKIIAEFIINVIANKSVKNSKVDTSLLELGLIQEISNPLAITKDKGESEYLLPKSKYQADFQVDFVEGVLTPKIIKEIKCTYDDQNLVRMYEKLHNTKRNKYLIYYNQPLIDVESMAKQIAEEKKAEKAEKKPKKVGGRWKKRTKRKRHVKGGWLPSAKTRRNKK